MKPRNVILAVLGVAVVGAIYLVVRQELPSASVQTGSQAVVQTPSPPTSPPPAAPAPVSQPQPAAPALSSASQQAESVPAFHASAKAARPLPATLSPDLFAAIPVVARAYRIAKRIPEVLAQQPCYCHCDRIGHVGLLDCYRTDHGAG